MQGTGVNSLIQEDLYAMEQLSLCTATTEPVALEPANLQVVTTEPTCRKCWSLTALEPRLHERSHYSEKPVHQRVAPAPRN